MNTTGVVQGQEAPDDVPDDDGEDGGDVGEDVVKYQFLSHPRSASENDSRSH